MQESDQKTRNPPAFPVTRRSALQGLAGGLGLALGVPAAAHGANHPLAAHIAQRAPATPTAARTPDAPKFLDAHQFATLTIVSDIIVPGSVASGSPLYIDSVLAIEREDVRRTFVGALAALDAVARDRHGATFRAVAAAQQLSLLEEAAAAAPEQPASAPPPPDAPAPSSHAPRTVPLRHPVSILKTWIAGAHYSSEAGMKTLGFTGTVFFQDYPACAHADGHQ